jgi:hypothetical protein
METGTLVSPLDPESAAPAGAAGTDVLEVVRAE